jgi:hypothetical protein
MKWRKISEDDIENVVPCKTLNLAHALTPSLAKSQISRPDNHIKGTSRIAESRDFLLYFGKETNLNQKEVRDEIVPGF